MILRIERGWGRGPWWMMLCDDEEQQWSLCCVFQPHGNVVIFINYRQFSCCGRSKPLFSLLGSVHCKSKEWWRVRRLRLGANLLRKSHGLCMVYVAGACGGVWRGLSLHPLVRKKGISTQSNKPFCG